MASAAHQSDCQWLDGARLFQRRRHLRVLSGALRHEARLEGFNTLELWSRSSWGTGPTGTVRERQGCDPFARQGWRCSWDRRVDGYGRAFGVGTAHR